MTRKDQETPRRARMIAQSLCALHFGCWAMLPMAGFLLGPLALYALRRSRALTGEDWNPAHAHALCGGLLGALGFLTSCAWLTIFLR